MVLFNDGIMLGSYKSNKNIPNEFNLSKWTYDDQTKTLATDAAIGNNNLQWQLTMINEDSWTGLPLWNDKSTTAANNKLEALDVAMLLNGKWENESGETITFNSFRDENDKYHGHTIWLDYYATEKPSVDLNNQHKKTKAIKFDTFITKQRLVLNYYYRDRDNDYYQGKPIEQSFSLSIDDPYNYYNAKLTQLLILTESYLNGKIVTNYKFNAKNYHRKH